MNLFLLLCGQDIIRLKAKEIGHPFLQVLEAAIVVYLMPQIYLASHTPTDNTYLAMSYHYKCTQALC